MEISDIELEEISLAGFTVMKLVPGVKKGWQKEVNKDKEYQKILRKIDLKESEVDERFGKAKEGSLTWKGRLYAPKGFRKEILDKEHNSKVAGHFGREKTMELFTRNLNWLNLEEEVREYCNKCDNCQRTKTPRHAKHGLLHPLELPSLPWNSISIDFITDLPESDGNKNIMVVVDRFTKMSHFIPLDK